MASKRLFVVFVLPIVLSIGVASAAMADILDRPGRELVMWPPQSGGGHGAPGLGHSGDIRIEGLAESYATGESIAIRVAVGDVSFDCGDLYITIYGNDDSVLSQKAYFSQCFAADGDDLPVQDEFAAVISSPGSYALVAEMRSGAESIAVLGEFVVE